MFERKYFVIFTQVAIMLVCGECGESLQEKWVTCPFCSSPLNKVSDSIQESSHKSKDIDDNSISETNKSNAVVITKTDNTVLWNVVIVGLTAAVLLYPTGIFSLSIAEKAFFDCGGFDEAFGDSNCSDMKTRNATYMFLSLLCAICALAINNKKIDKSKIRPEKVNKQRVERVEISKEQRVTRFLLLVNLILIPIFGTLLTLSVNVDPDQYICDNGESVDADLINDNIVDCSDGSDESVEGDSWIWEQNLSSVVPSFVSGLVVLFVVNFVGLKKGLRKP